MKPYSLLLKNVRVFDPLNNLDMQGDIAISEGKIAAIEADISPSQAKECHDLQGATAVPGIIDPHVHVGDIWGSRYSQPMLAKAGVCTALDMAGPLDNILSWLPEYGAGLNVAILQYASPPFTFTNSSPSRQEIDEFVNASLTGGAYGVKILGGHYPVTPDASRELIAQTRKQGGYVAWHAGTTDKGSNIEGMREAIECADGNFIHLAHINSYCRGAVRPEIEETQEAISLLLEHPNIYSESYLSPLNGTRLTCENGVPKSLVTCNSLKKLGYEATEAGIEAGFKAGNVYCIVDRDNESKRLTGEEGLRAWREHGTDLGGMFPVNSPVPRYILATAKRPTGDFVVDCFSTDGGCIPRNVIVEMGLALVALEALTLADFVRKTSWNPSRMLRLPNKGTLGIGMDADITVLDLKRHEPVATIASGKVAMLHGKVLGQGTHIICTKQGEKAIRKSGLTPYLADPSTPPLKMSETR